ncbi:hypothetical protein ACFY7A_30425 [Streptomyces longwoodensis]|uniref:hypothetical protein n=1 Tax=Streptomyces longwoodensis TaxID=68231 RepID=UPI0036BB2B26
MLTEEDARRLALTEIEDLRGHVTYDLKSCVQRRCRRVDLLLGAVGNGQSGQRPRLGGNGPFLVDRENERLIRTVTSVPVARQIADYERRLRREAHARNTAAKRTAQQR